MRRDQTPSSPAPPGGTELDPLARFEAGSRELEEAYRAGAPGLDLARRRAFLTDEALTDLWQAADVPDGWSLLALGGYGRSQLAPHSDIDLMILHASRSGSRVARVAQRIFYPLWDAGLEVGHAVRTLRQALEAANENLKTQTTLLDARLLAGPPDLAEELSRRLLTHARRQGGKLFFDALRSEVKRRHDESGKSAYLLEPDIKEGLGGLRDIQAISLLGAVLLGLYGVEALTSAGELSEADAAALDAAHAFLWTVRTHLHYRSGRRDDRLAFDHQVELAAVMGYGDVGAPGRGPLGALPAELFMTKVFEHTGQVERVSTVFWERQAARLRPPGRGDKRRLNDDLIVRAGHVALADPRSLSARPGLILGLFATAVEEGLPVAAEAVQAIQAALPTLPEPAWDDPTADAFFSLLARGPQALPALELLTQMGVLSYFIPEWDKVKSLVQFDAYHILTVDLHALHTVAEIGKLREGRYVEPEPVATEAAKAVKDWRALLLAALLHDLGKAGGRDHARRGAALAPGIAARLGMDEQAGKTVAFLVGSHLLLYDTATRRDLNDERVAVAAAQEVRTPERLRQLYLLTVADALATGPKAWTPWKSALVAELAVKVLHILERGELARKDTRRKVTDTKRAVMAKLSSRHSARRIDAFLDSMPYAYLIAHAPEEISRHFELMEEARGRDVRVAVRPGRRAGLYELTVVTQDQSDLFATVAGALALNGVTIHSAEIYLRANRQALILFSVADAFGTDIEQDRWGKVEDHIVGALHGRIALVWRLAERAERYRDKGRPSSTAGPRVSVDNEASDFYTLVEVLAPDRVGLLFTITKTLHELRLRIHQARVSTHGDEAADVFYVLDRAGEKIADEQHIEEIERAHPFSSMAR